MTPTSPKSQPPAAMRAVPAVHRLLGALADVDLPRPVVLAVIRRHLDTLRGRIASNGEAVPDENAVASEVRKALTDLRHRRLRPVINATGILIHTNLGRSPLSEPAVEAVMQAARDYTNLEYDLLAGQRGGRAASLEHALALLCEAEAATVVNNCAAALVLILRHLAKPPRTRVVISRGELVQIGGGFRIPEILEASGATLREVGTTNRTTIDDYRHAIDDGTAMILQVHRSNFYLDGFVASPTTRELAGLAREAGVPLVIDLGSGATFDTTTLGGGGGGGGGEREPTPAAALEAGADLVCFSGDKLLGGPQAGIIAGRAQRIAALKREPFFRALRCDKLVLSALQATVEALLDERVDEVPIRRMMRLTPEDLRPRAERMVAALDGAATVGTGTSRIGGGSLPRTALPSVTVDLAAVNPQALAKRLRLGEMPVIGYVAEQRLKLDLRTVFPRQDDELIAAIRRAMQVA